MATTTNSKTTGKTAKGLGLYTGIAGAVLSLVALITYFVYIAASGDANALIILMFLITVALEAITIAKGPDFLAVFTPVLCAVALCAFLMDSVINLVGIFTGLAMFGDASLSGNIFTVIGFAAAAMILLLVSAYSLKKQ